MAAVKSFLGIGWSFPPVFNEHTGSVEMISDEDDIRQSLFILLSTAPGERITNLNYGCDLQSVLFDPIDATTEALVREVIHLAVLFYEPRVTLDEVAIDARRETDGILDITLHYTVRKTNVRHNIVFPFYKIEGTNIVEV